MTNEELRKLDVWIAKHVMGLVLWPNDSEVLPASLSHMVEKDCPHYSTDISAAHEALEAVDGADVMMDRYHGMWRVSIGGRQFGGPSDTREDASLPLAICKSIKEAKQNKGE